jgi:2'-5' RNA ligase
LAGDRERLFVALWPDTAVRDRIAAVAEDPRLAARGGRPVAVDNLHLTVTFIGAVAVDDGERIRDLVSRFSATPCELELDRIGYFPHSRVLWLGAGEAPTSLKDDKIRLDKGLRDLGCRIERRPFSPHVTLYRKSRAVPAVDPGPIRWPVHEWVLVRSKTEAAGPVYEIVARSGVREEGSGDSAPV